MIKNIFIGWYRFLFNKQSRESRRRMKICKRCEFNDHNWCMKCGCFLPAKTKVESEKCHENKW